VTGESHASETSFEGLLARFITDPGWLHSDNSIRADAFIPPKDLNLSVTSHMGIEEKHLWEIGVGVAAQVARSRSPTCRLVGRGDISCSDVRSQSLLVQAAPLPENPNHVHISGWPEKPHRKRIAQELAKRARFQPTPSG